MKYKKDFNLLKDKSELFNSMIVEREKVGYFSLPYKDISYLKKLDDFKYDEVAIIGIGGSSLGVEAIYNFLRYKKKLKRLTIFDTTDPINLDNKLSNLSKNTIFILISKSGRTIETISIFKYVSSKINLNSSNLIVISDKGSVLDNFAKDNNLSFFEIEKNVGGRFSVFSNVGIVPMYLIGVDIDMLLKGAKKVIDSFFNKSEFYEPLMQKALFLTQFKHKYNINVLFSYSSLLEGFNRWYVQLWGESLGKINEYQEFSGLTPIGLIGPNDQHSFLQLIIEGSRDKTVTFIKVDDFEQDIKIPNTTLKSIDSLDIVSNISFNKLINLQASSTYEAIQKLGDIPVDIIEIEKVDENNIAKLMQSYMVLTSLMGIMLGINTYNQPGVEIGKQILKEKLFKLNISNN